MKGRWPRIAWSPVQVAPWSVLRSGASALLLLGASALILLGALRPAAASESIFGLQFLGTSDETGDGRARGLGILGVALDDTTTAITPNPAAYGGLHYMTFSFMGVMGSRTARTATEEVQDGFARFPHVRVAIPLFGRVVLGTGFSGFRNTRGGFSLAPRSIDGLGYRQSFERDGSLYTLPIVVAAGIGSRVRVGVSVDFLLGTVDEKWISAGDSLLNLATRRRDEMRGTSVRLGVMSAPWPWLRVGAAWSPEFNAERERRTTLEDATPGSTAAPIRHSSLNTDVNLPQMLQGGAAIKLGREWLVAGDFLWRDWPTYDGSTYEASGVRAETRYGAGLEYRVGLWSYIRAGVSRWTWGFDAEGAAVRETAIHFGGGVPLSPGKGGVHFALEHAWIGSLADNGLEERAWRVVVSVSGQETWLRKAPHAR